MNNLLFLIHQKGSEFLETQKKQITAFLSYKQPKEIFGFATTKNVIYIRVVSKNVHALKCFNHP